jgi:hypothetical protein
VLQLQIHFLTLSSDELPHFAKSGATGCVPQRMNNSDRHTRQSTKARLLTTISYRSSVSEHRHVYE